MNPAVIDPVNRSIASLKILATHSCGMRHDQRWQGGGQDLPQCSSHLREQRIGCSHSSNLALRSAATLCLNLNLIDRGQYGAIQQMLLSTSEFLSSVDIEAQELSISIERRKKNIALPVDMTKLNEVAHLCGVPAVTEKVLEEYFERQQANYSEPLVALRHILLSLLVGEIEGEAPSQAEIKSYFRKLTVYNESARFLKEVSWRETGA